MFDSRFLKSSSCAVLSASVVSMAQGANGFANMELDNQGAAFENSDGENIFSSPLKQEELKTDDVSSVDEIKDLKPQGLGKDVEEKEENKKKDRRIWPWFVFGIPAVVFIVFMGGVFLYFRTFFNCGTEEFQKLDFRKKIEMILDFTDKIYRVKKIGGLFLKVEFDGIVEKYSKYFDLVGTFRVNGINFKKVSKYFKKPNNLFLTITTPFQAISK